MDEFVKALEKVIRQEFNFLTASDEDWTKSAKYIAEKLGVTEVDTSTVQWKKSS